MQPVHNFSRSSVTSPQKVRPVPVAGTSVSAPGRSPPRVYYSEQNHSQAITIGQPIEQRPIEEQLFFALADAKIWTSRVAMHLDRLSRNRMFRQLDVLHEFDEWATSDRPVQLEAYKSFVRAIVFHKINSRPALSLMPSGNLLALWNDSDDRLTIEFLPENRTRWLVQSSTTDGPERASGTSPLERLRDVLQPYGAARWFDGC